MPKNPDKKLASNEQPKNPDKQGENTLAEIEAKEKEIRERIFCLIFEPEKQKAVEKMNGKNLMPVLLNLKFTSMEQFVRCLEACKKLEEAGQRFSENTLVQAASVYKSDAEICIQCAEICTQVAQSPSNKGGFAIEALQTVQGLYGNSLEKFKLFASVAREGGEDGIKALESASCVYGNDEEKLAKCAEICLQVVRRGKNSPTHILVMLRRITQAYENSIEKFEAFAQIGSDCGVNATVSLIKMNRLYGDDIEKLKECATVYLKIIKEGGQSAIDLLENIHEYLGDVETYKKYTEICIKTATEGKDVVTKALCDIRGIYKGNLDTFKECAEIFLELNKKNRDALPIIGDMLNKNGSMEKLKILVKIADKADEKTLKLIKENREISEMDIKQLELFANKAEEGGTPAIKALLKKMKKQSGQDNN